MKIDIIIDKLTPCLVEIATGKILQTTFSTANMSDLVGLQEKGWYFDWTDKELEKCNIYKLQLKGDDIIQGIIAAEVVKGAVYAQLAESAPHNQKPNQKYKGVGGHLLAIAMKLSMVNGFGGYIFFDAKNPDLVKHYTEMLGAEIVATRFHDYRMQVFEEQAQEVIEKYTLEGDLNVY